MSDSWSQEPDPRPMRPETMALLARPNFAHLATLRPDGSLRGTATVEPDPEMAVMDRISHKYIGAAFPMRDNIENRVVLTVRITQSRYSLLPFEHTPPNPNPEG